MKKNVYFLSDAHLGSRAIPHGRMQERRLVRFLDSIKDKASAVYFLGDMFDFWFEYKLVVPKGYTRFLGKVSELTDNGVEVHFFTGNHDIWCGDYLEKECGVIMHRKEIVTEIYGKVFFLAHGDGLGDKDKKFRFLRWLFHNKAAQTLFAAIHPRWAVDLGKAQPHEARRRQRAALHGRGQRILGALCQGISRNTSRDKLFHLRTPPHRTRPYAAPRLATDDSWRLD